MHAFRPILFVIAAFPLLSEAEVTEVSTNGFTVSHTVNSPASPQQSWTTMTRHIDSWWDPEHSWSGDAKNLYITLEAGGCFCERLPADAQSEAGGVEHLHIIYNNPPQELRFDGALGPLQSMNLHGRMIWTVAPAESGSSITFTYMLTGVLEGGFEGLSQGVDGVIGLQLNRLAQRLATPQ